MWCQLAEHTDRHMHIVSERFVMKTRDSEELVIMLQVEGQGSRVTLDQPPHPQVSLLAGQQKSQTTASA